MDPRFENPPSKDRRFTRRKLVAGASVTTLIAVAARYLSHRGEMPHLIPEPTYPIPNVPRELPPTPTPEPVTPIELPPLAKPQWTVEMDRKIVNWQAGNETSRDIVLNPKALKDRYKFSLELARKYFQQPNEKTNYIWLQFIEKESGPAASTNVFLDKALILINTGISGREDSPIFSFSESLEESLADEIANVVAADSGSLKNPPLLGDTEVEGLSQWETWEVFSSGFSKAASAIFVTNEQPDYKTSTDKVYDDIYVPLIDYYPMPSLYFQDRRTTQKAFKMTRKEFADFSKLLTTESAITIK